MNKRTTQNYIMIIVANTVAALMPLIAMIALGAPDLDPDPFPTRYKNCRGWRTLCDYYRMRKAILGFNILALCFSAINAIGVSLSFCVWRFYDRIKKMLFPLNVMSALMLATNVIMLPSIHVQLRKERGYLIGEEWLAMEFIQVRTPGHYALWFSVTFCGVFIEGATAALPFALFPN